MLTSEGQKRLKSQDFKARNDSYFTSDENYFTSDENCLRCVNLYLLQ